MPIKPLFTGSEWDFNLIKNTMNVLDDIVPELKLDTYVNSIEIVNSEQMLDAYTSVGLPVMYKHWSFGKKHAQQSQSYKRGHMGLAMELVLNTDPCINFLMEENSATTQVLVLAHAAFGHNHVFKNNYMFRQWTDASSIVDYLNFSKNFITECEERYGVEKVEKTLDAAHALMNHGVDRCIRPTKLSLVKETEKREARKEYLQQQVNDLWRTVPKDKKEVVEDKKFLKQPEENLLYFLEKKSPKLEDWQREILRIVRKISQYFEPQRQCLIGSHLVSTPIGLVKLENLIKEDGYIENDQILLLTEGNKFTPISHTYKHEAETLIITTESGRKFTATSEHPLQILSDDLSRFEMREMGDMKIGNHLVYQLNYDIFPDECGKIKYHNYGNELAKCALCGLTAPSIASHLVQRHNIDLDMYKEVHGEYISDIYRMKRSVNNIINFPERFDNEISRIFAYLLNSYISKTTQNQAIIEFSTDSIDIASDFSSCLLSAFGINVAVTQKLDLGSKYYVTFSSMRLKKLYYDHVDEFRNKHSIPDFVFTLNKSASANFIKAYFDSLCNNFQYSDSRLRLSGYSTDECDLLQWMTLLLGHGIMPVIKKIERESFESIAYSMGIENTTDIKACDYSLRIPGYFVDRFLTNIGTSRNIECNRKLSARRKIPGIKNAINEVRDFIKEAKIEHLNGEDREGHFYWYNKKHGLLTLDTGLYIEEDLPGKYVDEVSYEQIILNSRFVEKLENIKEKSEKIITVLRMVQNCLDTYYDKIISIEQGPTSIVYDVTVPENHLFWCDGIISHNTKTLNEGWASFTHYYLMNRLWDKGYLTEGAMLEFYQLHTSVLQQPGFDSKYYSGMNPYYLGFEIFSDIRRICTEPTKEDEEYFPDLVHTDWVDACLDAVANYRDESFIRQFLSPHLCRKMKLFLLSDDSNSDHTIKAIHNELGYKDIRRTLADSYLSENYIPKIEIIDVDYNGTRKLTLMYSQKNNRNLSAKAAKVVAHIKELWGFPVEMVDVDGKWINFP